MSSHVKPGVRSSKEFAEDYLELRSAGLTHREIAKRLGYQHSSMSQTISRARRRGLLPPYAGYDPAFRIRAQRLRAGA